MALVVEDGTGLSTANSYLTLAAAELYFADYPHTAWTVSVSDGDKTAALLAATQYLDAVYGRRWRGDVLTATQSLDWPRIGAYDNNGTLIASDEVPTVLEWATAEAAARSIEAIAASTSLVPDVASPGDIKEELNKVGPLTERIEYMGGKSQVKQYRTIELLLADLVTSAQGVERG